MPDQARPLPQAEQKHPRTDWMTELRHILFDGAGPAESRLELFLDRLERRP